MENTGANTGPKLVEQAHGGAILQGGNPGNKGGPGRPPSALRERMRGSLEERLKVLEEIADDSDSRPADRIRAVEVLARYGLGSAHELSGPDQQPMRIDAKGARDRIIEKLEKMAKRQPTREPGEGVKGINGPTSVIEDLVKLADQPSRSEHEP